MAEKACDLNSLVPNNDQGAEEGKLLSQFFRSLF